MGEGDPARLPRTGQDRSDPPGPGGERALPSTELFPLAASHHEVLESCEHRTLGLPRPHFRSTVLATPHLRPLGFGEILDGVFALYRRHFVQLFLVGFIPLIPLVLGAGLVLIATLLAPGPGADVLLGLFVIVGALYWIFAAAISWTALATMFDRAVLGDFPPWREALRIGLGKAPSVIWASLLFWVAVGVVTMACFVLVAVGVVAATAIAGSIGIASGITAAILTPLAIAVGAFPAAFVWVGLTLYLPAIVSEGVPGIESLRRSWSLMSGGRWKGFGLWVVGWLIVMVPSLLVTGFLMLVFGVGAFLATDSAEAASMTAQVLNQLAQPFVSALTTPFSVGLLVLLYLDRRVRVEGFDLELAEARMVEEDPGSPIDAGL